MYGPPDECIRLSFFCKKCYTPLLRPITKSKLKNCEVKSKCGQTYLLSSKNDNHIVNVDIEYEIKMLLQDEEVESELLKNLNVVKKMTNKNSTDITDVYDDELYKELLRKYSLNSNVLTYIFNTDVAPIFHSSKLSLWSIQIIINELPPRLRFKYLLLAGICILKQEPSAKVMNMYMEQFMQETKSLRENGFEIMDASGEVINIKLLPLCSSVDTVARPIIQNRMQYDSRQRCSWCYQFGEYHDTMRYPVTEKNAQLCTDNSHRRDVKSVEKGTRQHKNVKEVNGVKGASVLMTLLSFDMIWGFPVDYMHGVLLGVTKQL